MNGTYNLADLIPWRRLSGNLTAHTMKFLVNRSDVWGAYTHTHQRGNPKTPDAWTAPSVKNRGEVELQFRDVRRHFNCDDGSVIGLHSTSADGRCRWGAIDIDQHDHNDLFGDAAERNLRFAIDIATELEQLGFESTLIEDSNGRGGLHIWFLFKSDDDRDVSPKDRLPGVPSRLAHRFGCWLVRKWQDYNFDQQPEVFPKQPELTETRQLGNWLRLPGIHHTDRSHVSRFYDTNSHRWLEGEDACRRFLSSLPDDPSLIPQEVFEFRTAEEIEAEERQVARQHQPDRHRHHSGCGCHDNGVRPGDDYNENGESFEDLLYSLGWSHVGGELWRRPGKTDSHSATLRDGVFYNFSAASELPHSEGMTKFGVYVHGFHGGNFAMAAAELARQGFGSKESEPEPDWEDKALADIAGRRFRANGHTISCGCHHCGCEDAGVCPRDCDCPTCESERAERVADDLKAGENERLRLGFCGGRRLVAKPGEKAAALTNDCNRWDCECCRKELLGEWRPHWNDIIVRETKGGKKLHVGDVRMSELNAVKRSLRHQKARYGSIADEAVTNTAMVISTVPFESSEPMGGDELIQLVQLQLDWIDRHGVPRKPIFTCRAWERGTVDEPAVDNGWRTINCDLSSGWAIQQACKELGLRCDGFDNQNMTRGQWGEFSMPDFAGDADMKEWFETQFCPRVNKLVRQGRDRAVSSNPKTVNPFPGIGRHDRSNLNLMNTQPRGEPRARTDF